MSQMLEIILRHPGEEVSDHHILKSPLHGETKESTRSMEGFIPRNLTQREANRLLIPPSFLPMTFLAFFEGGGVTVASRLPARVLDGPTMGQLMSHPST
jgi:hypothetical protein